MEPIPVRQREVSNASTFARRESPIVVDMSARRGGDGPVDNSAQRVQRPRASGGDVVARDDSPLIIIPDGIPARGPMQNPDRAGQQLPPPEVARQPQFPAQRYHNIFGDQGRQNPPPRAPVLEADQRQPHSARELAVPRPPAQNHARENPPLEVARNQQLIEIPPGRDSAQRSQRNIAVVGNDGLQGRQPPPAGDFLQPMPPRDEINPNIAQVAQTFIPILESILALSQNIVWVLTLLFFFVVLVLITSRIVRFFLPLEIGSPRLSFRLLDSGYSNSAVLSEMAFPLSINNPFLFIGILLGAIVITRIIAFFVKVCSTSPSC